ncbi:unnamed protein product [Mytilus coruscus]|uniref:Ig-like domain-containing protein n=1 Tax=Mytilus coruscus TaxID=42192 RepID=A0A6J8C8R9_MYTCO|nr:unnamed protein product [Mytilus coruscus]
MKYLQQFVCNNSKEVQLSCTITSNALSFGFDSWTHTYNGVFIRHLKGINVGNTSVVLINTCQFYDCGQYKCRAWKRDESGLKWIEKAGELKVSGPPFIVETQAISTPDLSFAAKFVSLPIAYYLEWYISEEVLNNSSKYNRTFTRDTFTVYIHGVPVTVAGYKATLTIDSKEEMETDEQVYFAAPFEENEPNVYNEIVADSDEIMSNHHHQYFDIEISHEDTQSNSYDESSNNC